MNYRVDWLHLLESLIGKENGTSVKHWAFVTGDGVLTDERFYSGIESFVTDQNTLPIFTTLLYSQTMAVCEKRLFKELNDKGVMNT